MKRFSSISLSIRPWLGQYGFTVVELMVALVVMLVLMAATFAAMQAFTRSSAQKMAINKLTLTRNSNLSLLRLDLMHAGYGIDSSEAGLAWDGTRLTIRSTLNNLNTDTMGWVFVDCPNTSTSWSSSILVDGRMNSSNNALTFLTPQKGYVGSVATASDNCPATGELVGYPYDTASSNNCTTGICERIDYQLSSSQTVELCQPQTRNLLRIDYRPGANYVPILNCIADWDLRFDLDTDGDGVVDATKQNSFTDPHQVKLIHIYLLAQNGRFDPDYNFSGNTTAGGIEVDGVTLTLPNSNFKNYRWKVVQFTVETPNL